MNLSRPLLLAVPCALFLYGQAAAANLEVLVTDLRSSDGVIRLAIYDDPDRFPKVGGARGGQTVAIKNATALTTFTDLPPGRYAIAAYHDEDGDNEFDQNFIGLPQEGYGFSNGATVFLGPPSFDDAAIDVDSVDRSITVQIHY